MKISYVVPAYNEEAYLGACLEALRAELQTVGTRFAWEIIVVNNGSTDKTNDVANSFEGVRVVHEPQTGVSRARQRGLNEATGDIVAFIDADSKISKGWTERVVSIFKKDERIVSVSGPYIYYDLPVHWRVIAWPYEILFGYLMQFVTGYCVVGGNFAAKRLAMREVGGFDTSIVFYGEDLDIARRLSAVGKLVYSHRIAIASSARRFNAEGIVVTGIIYGLNSISMALFKRPVSFKHRDIR